MFYMHLKQDHRLFTGVFVFPLIIATVIILALIVLEAYHFAFARVRVTLLPFAPLLDERPRPTVPYEWAWSLHPSVLLGTGLLGALYFYGIGPWRRAPRPAAGAALEGGVASSRRCSCCSASLNGPMHDLSDYYLFSVHMAQHLLLTLVFPPLLILGLPGWLVEPLLRRRPCAGWRGS